MKKYHGLLAINPRAIADLDEPKGIPPVSAPLTEGDADVCVVDVRGCLYAEPVPGFDDYSSLVARVAAAFEQTDKVVLSLDTPGGVVSGLFNAVRAIRAMVTGERKLYAYVRDQACSAGYALACAADKIWSAPEAVVGSIGVIDTLVDATVADAKDGLRFQLVTSGARKADGNPHQLLQDDAIRATQLIVDELAQGFFEHVASRRLMTAETVAGFEAAVFTGTTAKKNGLVDQVGSLSDCLAAINGPVAATRKRYMQELIDKLRETAEGDDEIAAKFAKKCLSIIEAAIGGDEKKEDEAPKEPAAVEGEEVEDEEEEPEAAEKEDEKKASTVVAALQAQVNAATKALNEVRKELDESKRAALLASRPDLDAKTRDALASAPLSTVEFTLNLLPKTNVLASRVLSAEAPTSGTSAAKLTPAQEKLCKARGWTAEEFAQRKAAAVKGTL